jgi:hypothetical protein
VSHPSLLTFLALADKQAATAPLVIGHRMMGQALLFLGDFVESRAHLDRAFALYDPAVHRSLAMRFGQDARMSTLCLRSWTSWWLGYPEAALADARRAVSYAREIDQAATLMYALCATAMTQTYCGNYSTVDAQCDEIRALADEKDALLWKAYGMLNHGGVLSLTGKAADATHVLSYGITAWRSTGAKVFMPLWLSFGEGTYGN